MAKNSFSQTILCYFTKNTNTTPTTMKVNARKKSKMKQKTVVKTLVCIEAYQRARANLMQ